MELFSKALEVVARVMREGAATHPDNDWIEHSSEYHLGRAQDHMSHAATRLLMALTLRELEGFLGRVTT
jgi:hypothetical protein